MRTFGLIGYPLSHSFSPGYFTEKFKKECIADTQYLPFELGQIEDFVPLVKGQVLSGLNVTIPYKQAIIPYLDRLDETVKAVGAVNTIQFENGELVGYNTDVIGFRNSIEPYIKSHHKRAVILGTGGAAKAVEFIMKQLGLPFLYVSRTKQEGRITYDELDLKDGDIIINTTPLGMHPNIDQCPAIPYNQINESHLLYDLVYNPTETKFLANGKAQGTSIKNGLDMLHLQAEAAWKIWNKAN